MKNTITNIVKYILFLGIGVFLVWWSLHQIPDDKWNDFKQSLLSANFWLLIPVFIILSLSHILRAIRWKTLMHPMGYHPSIANTFFAVMIGYLANLAFPRLGEVLKCTLLTKYENVPTEKLVGTIVVERIVDVICLATVFVLAFIIQNDVFLNAFEHMQSMMQTDATSTKKDNNTLKYIILSLVLIGCLYFWLSGKAKKTVDKLKGIFKGLVEGLMSIKHMQQKQRFILCTIGIWLLYIVGTWVGLYATNGSSH
ncbi:MAG: lysylphosphatidylglycerol synthase transmembrane domain-containing protein, partial [Chitinophagaceae bacterium]